MTAQVALVAGSVWVQGQWIERVEDLVVPGVVTQSRARIDLDPHFGSGRIARADRFTQLGALVLAKVLAGLVPLNPEQVALVTASALASAHTNERFERRRREGRAPEPRLFPYTAPNAGGGEWSIAAGVRGPILTLVGGPEVALAALERASSWIARARCQRAFVVAVECPPEHADLVAPPGIVPMECAAAVVIEALDGCLTVPRLRVCYTEGALQCKVRHSPLLSVQALAQVALASQTGGMVARQTEVEVGAGLEAVIEVAKCPSSLASFKLS